MKFTVGDNKDVIKEIEVDEPFKIKKETYFSALKTL